MVLLFLRCKKFAPKESGALPLTQYNKIVSFYYLKDILSEKTSKERLRKYRATHIHTHTHNDGPRTINMVFFYFRIFSIGSFIHTFGICVFSPGVGYSIELLNVFE